MSGTRLRGWGLVAILSVTAGLVCVRGAAADDLLDQARRRKEIEAQKTIGEVKDLIAESRIVQKKDAAAARDALRRARLLIEDARGVSDRDRADLLAQIRTRLRDVEAALREEENAARADAYKADIKRREEERRREREAQAKQDSSYGKAKEFFKIGQDALSDYAKLRQRREQGVLAIGRETEKTFGQMTEQRITKAFVEAGERRKPKLSQAEKDLLKMLNSTLSVDFKNTPLKDVIEYLHDKTGQNIFIDENSLKEAMVEYDDPVTFKARKVTVRTILKKVLADKGLTFIIKEAAIQVMTPAKAKEHVVTRAYPVGDLLPLIDPRLSPVMNRIQQIEHVKGLILMIQDTVDPASWQANGGTGTIRFEPTTMSLVIRNTAEFHYQMGGYLSR
jgi:hypothetical protein